MISVKQRFLILAICIFLSAWLLVAQVFGNQWILLPCLISFLALSAWSSVQGVALPVLLFFLPFAPLLKLGQGKISFFTLALLMVYLVYVVLGSRNIKVYHLIPALLIIVLTLIIKTILGYDFENSYILFSLALLLVPFVSREIDGKYDFYWLTVFFSLGIIIAAITAQYLAGFPNIAGYIKTFNLDGAFRHAGYSGDPNFYSAHIVAALAGVLVLSFGTLSKIKRISLIVMAALLFYCGLLSLSKSFILVFVCILLIWILAMMFNKGRISQKTTILFFTGIAIIFLLSSTIFTDSIDALVVRFTKDNNLVDFTTGRLAIWEEYFDELGANIWLLVFGRGLSDVLVAGRAAHNTVIQCVFQLGIIGSVLIFVWFLCLFNNFLHNIIFKREGIIPIFILLIGAFGPWLALDVLFFDEFFIIPMYVCLGIRHIFKKETTVTITTRAASEYDRKEIRG